MPTMSITSRTTAETVTILAALAGQRITITTIVRWDQMIAEDEITYRPVHRTHRGTIVAIEARELVIRVHLAPDSYWDGDDYLGGDVHLTLYRGTPFEVVAD